MTTSTDALEGVAPQPRYVEHITFEGRDCVVLSPEEYEALWEIALRAAPPTTNNAEAQVSRSAHVVEADQAAITAASAPSSVNDTPAPSNEYRLMRAMQEDANKSFISFERKAPQSETAQPQASKAGPLTAQAIERTRGYLLAQCEADTYEPARVMINAVCDAALRAHGGSKASEDDELGIYTRTDGHREWWSGGAWLYPGDAIVLRRQPRAAPSPDGKDKNNA